MFYKKDNTPYKTAREGVHFKTLVHGQNTSLHEFRLDSGSVIPIHSHPHEQTGYMVSGRMHFVLQDRKIFVERGDSWCIPGNMEHGVEVMEDSVVIEVFSPVRKEYLD